MIALGLFVSVFWLIVRAFAWRTLLQDKPSLGQTFLKINEGYLLNNILPFRLGEVGRAFLLGRRTLEEGKPLGFWKVFPTILIERAMDVVLAVSLLLSTLPFVVGASWARQAALAAGGVVAVALAALYLMARFNQKAIMWFDRLAIRWAVLRRIGRAQLEAFFAGLEVITKPGRFVRAVGLIILGWIIAVGQYFALLRAFFSEGELLWAAFSLGVVALGVAAPSSPGAVGVMELSMVGALAVFKLDASTALAMALTGHLINYLATGLIGAYGLAQDGMSLSGVYRQVRQIKPNPPA